MNQLRFQRLYFDAFIELVRMGVLVPALDGFEEIFVETSEGDAVSSLGMLIRQMHGEGTPLIAARRAYFEFRAAFKHKQDSLDAIHDADVAFGRVSIQRWSRTEVLTYSKLEGVPDPEKFWCSRCKSGRTTPSSNTRSPCKEIG